MSIIKKADQKVIDKPWGKEVIWTTNNHYAGKIITINAGERLSLQYHDKKTETILLLSGDLTVLGEAGTRPATLSIGDAFHVTPGTVHRFCAGKETATLIEVSTSELDDVVRLDDDYNR